jgi:hypothetical protein
MKLRICHSFKYLGAAIFLQNDDEEGGHQKLNVVKCKFEVKTLCMRVEDYQAGQGVAVSFLVHVPDR